MSASSDEPLILTVHYQLTKPDLVTYFSYRLWGQPHALRRVLVDCLVMVLIAAVVLSGVLMLAEARLSLAAAVATVVVSGVIGGLIHLTGVCLRPHTQARRVQKQTEALAPATLTVSPDGLLGSLEGQGFRRDWGIVEDIVTTRDHLFFEVGGQNALMVPRRAFASPAEAEKFFAVAREYQSNPVDARCSAASEAAVDAALGPDRLAVTLTLTERDVARFQWYQVRRNPRMVLRAGIPAFVFGCIAGFLWNPVAGVAVAASDLAWRFLVTPWQVRRHLRGIPEALGRQRLFVSPAALWVTTPALGDGRVEWSAITEVVATEHMVLLYRDEQTAHIVPRRAFPTPEDAETFLLRATEWRALAIAGAASPAAADKMG